MKDDAQSYLQIDHKTHILLKSIKLIKNEISVLKKKEEMYKKELLKKIGEHEELIDDCGEVVATYRRTKPVTKFDNQRFKNENPDIYEKYVYEDLGFRRLVISEVLDV